ncbi:EthD domain-containing protein [Nocardia sp. CA-135398]|uniref:EthD domain-containing protein n=1 Tax=Nocardia sp. CA-135398 TaxID=3239977 RepID=UPI003D96F939
MVKLVLIIKKRADISQADFENHWRGAHALLVQKHAETLRIKKYVQSIGCQSEVVAQLRAERGWSSETEVDGVAELYWDSEEDMAAGMSTPEGQAAMKELGEDELNLGDALDVLMTKENVVINR